MASTPTLLLLLSLTALLAGVASTEANEREDPVSMVPFLDLVSDEETSLDLTRKGRRKRCILNRQKYTVGQVMMEIPKACADLVCLKPGKKAMATLVPREDCACDLPQSRLLPDETTTKARRGRRCKYNGKKVLVGEQVDFLDTNCLILVCRKNGRKKTIEVEYLHPCTCTANTSTTTPPQPTTPRPTTPQPTPQPTTPKPTTKTPVECDYSVFSPTHTMLKPPNEECNAHKRGVTEAEKTEILNKHNELRAKVARGDENQGDPGPQPSAANMRELVWNEELALVAQALAEQCKFGHDGYDERKICSRDYTVGQNIYKAWEFDPDSKWSIAVENWYSEVAYMPNTMVDSFTNSAPSGNAIGHYTQVVWASTSEVGCGAVSYAEELSGTKYPETKLYVCNYGEAGNFMDSKVYEKGSTASQCSNGPSVTHPDLCK